MVWRTTWKASDGYAAILYFLNKLVLGQTALHELDLVSLALEYVSPSLVDVLQQQNLYVLLSEGFELLACSTACSRAQQAWRRALDAHGHLAVVERLLR